MINLLMTAVWVAGAVFSAAVILWVANEMKDDPDLSVRGHVDIAFVAACGFSVFPVLNLHAGVWLLYEWLKHRRTKEAA